MIELRPALLPAEAPLVFSRSARPAFDASVRPLFRGAVLAALLVATLGLPSLRSGTAETRPPLRLSDATRPMGPASLQPGAAPVARFGR